MKFLLENQTLVSDEVLFEHNHVHLASIMNKMFVYNARDRYRRTYESSAYFSNSIVSQNPDILLNIEERQAVKDLFVEIRAHILEQMNRELSSQLVNEGFLDTARQKVTDFKKALGDKYDAIVNKYKPAITLLKELLSKAINSIKEFIAAVGQLFVKLGDNISDALKKLGAFEKDPQAEDDSASEVDASFVKEVPSEERSFFTHVIEYVKEMMTQDKKKALGLMNEGLIDTVANNKFLQYVIGHRKGKRWGIWHTILVSLVGSCIISFVLPCVLYVFGASTALTVTVCTSVAIVWQARGLMKVLLNRYLNKKQGEKFFNFPTVLGIFLAVVPVAVFRIPAVQDAVREGLGAFFELIHAHELIDKIEDFLAKLAEHFVGHNPTIGPDETVNNGKWVEEQIESLRNSGTTVTDLLNGNDATASGYIEHLFSDTPISGFMGKPEQIKDWLTEISQAKYSGSIDMLNSLPGLSSEAPITAVLDGNTWQHVSRSALTKAIEKYSEELGISCELIDVSNDALRASTKNMAGTAYALVMDANATEENAAILQNLLSHVAEDMNVHSVNSFGKVMNELATTQPVWHDDIVVNHTTIHTLFDTLTQCFNPVFVPWFLKDKWGKYMMRPGSNATGYPAWRVTEVRNMKLEDIKKLDPSNTAITLFEKHIQDVCKQQHSNIEQGIEQEKEENNGMFSKISRKFFRRKIEDYNNMTDPNNEELMVVFVSGVIITKDENGKKVKTKFEDKPAVAFDLTTLMCFDIMPWFKKRRKTPYFMKGLFSKLDFVPTSREDNDTKDFIHNMLQKTMESAIKQSITYGTAGMYVAYDEDKDEWTVKDEAVKDEKFFDMGNLTPQMVCDVMNGKLDPYTLFEGQYGELVKITQDENGNIVEKGAKENKNVIEKQRFSIDADGNWVKDPNGDFDYIDAKIIPFIEKNRQDVLDELLQDKDIKDLITDENGKFSDDIFKDKDLNLKRFLFRPMKTFSRTDKENLAKQVNEYLKGKSKKEKIELYNTLKKMIEIIWLAIYREYDTLRDKKERDPRRPDKKKKKK